MPEDADSKLIIENRLDELKMQANPALVACIERFMRVLGRLFTLGDLGGAARSRSGILWDFAMLDDNQLGTREYDAYCWGTAELRTTRLRAAPVERFHYAYLRDVHYRTLRNTVNDYG